MSPEYFELHGHALPAHKASPFTLSELENAGTKIDSLRHLEDDALALLPLTNRQEAAIVPKTGLYGNTGHECMFLVLEEGTIIHDITEMTPEAISTLLGYANQALSVYEEQLPPTDRSLLKVLSFNTQKHLDPHAVHAEEARLGTKLSSQTICSAHLHTVLLCESDKNALKPVKRTDMSIASRDTVHEPMEFFVEKIFSLPKIQKALFGGVVGITPIPDTRTHNPLTGKHYDGISFETTLPIESEKFATSVRQFAENVDTIFQDVQDIFVDITTKKTKAPRQRDEMFEKLTTFLTKYEGDTHPAGKQIRRLAIRLNDIFKTPAEALSKNATNDGNHKPRIALGDTAYTLSFFQTPGETTWTINIQPRVFSTGNVTGVLGYVRKPTTTPDESWWNKKQKTDKAIAAAFRAQDKRNLPQHVFVGSSR